ncbi:MAG: MBL fold metallo-hydrolase, partial [Oscillospiraceae bacterium]
MVQCCDYPWDVAEEPFRITTIVYYVSGIYWVCCFFLDSGDGLILLDCGMANTAYLLLESIRKLGYDPKDIRTIMISHAHYDHCGAARLLKEYTCAKLYMGERDMPFIREKTNLVFSSGYPFSTFQVDAYYDDDLPISIGRFNIRTMSTPGHTPGCTSFFFEDTDEETNRTYRCAIHGGVGLNTLTDQYFEETGEPVTLRQSYRKGMLRALDEVVDIVLPSHPNQTQMFQRNIDFANHKYPQEDSRLWREFISERLTMLDELEKNSKL